MKKVIFLFLLMTALSVQAQTEYKSLYEEAVRCAESDSLEQAETLFKKALKLSRRMLLIPPCFPIWVRYKGG